MDHCSGSVAPIYYYKILCLQTACLQKSGEIQVL